MANDILRPAVGIHDQTTGALTGFINPLTGKPEPTIQGLVSEAGNITAAELATTTGTLGQTVRLSDGDNKGAILMWSTPAGSSTPAWCWWLWPQSPYEA